MKSVFVYLCRVFVFMVIITSGTVFGETVGKVPFYDVRDYGAVADGQTKDTQAIRKAVETAAQAGGGTIYFSAGQYLTGSIHLRSNITIFLDAGAVLKFSGDFDDYLPMVKSRWEGTECINFSPPIYAYQAENIAIVGRGMIDGQGKIWWDFYFKLRDEYRKNGKIGNPPKWTTLFAQKNEKSPARARWKPMGDYLRPPLIQPFECRNVRIEGISLKDPPFWTINPVYCDNVTITGISIKNPADSPNTDGINPDSCSNVHISNCHINVGDDCIAIKSGRDEDGRRVGRPCENITVTNCTMLKGHGGVVIGSEMSGGVRKVTISNCVFDGTDKGIRIKTTRGRGGVVEDIRVSNIMMNNIPRGPIYLNMFYNKVPPEPVSQRTPMLRNIHFSNITVKGAPVAGYILGLDEMPVENVTFSDVNIDAERGFSCKNANNVAFHNVTVNTRKSPALICENIAVLEIDGFRSMTPHDDASVIELANVQDAYIRSCWAASQTKTFLGLKGENSRGIFLQGNYLGAGQDAATIVTGEGFPASALNRQ